MTAFSVTHAADIATLFGDVAGPAVQIDYTPAGGQVSSIMAILRPSEGGLEQEGDREHEVRVCEIIIRTDATAGIASPAVGDAVTINSENWSVAEITGMDHAGCIARLKLTREARITQGTPGSRLTTIGESGSKFTARP